MKMCGRLNQNRITAIQHAILERRYKFSRNKIPKINLAHYVMLLFVILLIFSLIIVDAGFFGNRKVAAISNDAVRFNAISTLSNLPSLTNLN
jgi:ABC-type transport system involved in cytochrome c biogenesis permease subunit